jgi:hypothetical protein
MDTTWTWDAEANYERLKKENPDIAHDAHRGHSVVDQLSQTEKAPHHRQAHGDV